MGKRLLFALAALALAGVVGLAGVATLTTVVLVFAQQGPPRLPDGVRGEFDIPYAGTDNPRQTLDLLLPEKPATDQPLPVVVLIHGGGWQNGDKRSGTVQGASLVRTGHYAAVSLGYRLTGEARWPAQIHDCKAAIRWIRAQAGRYNLDPQRIGVIGSSAGGHLAAMLGTSGDEAALEGDLGKHQKTSSRVQCVVDLFGPTDLVKLSRSSDPPHGAVARLLGGVVRENRELAHAASPITYVSRDDPPFLLIHGTQDTIVPYDQSELLQDALATAGVDSLLLRVEGGSHGSFRNAEVTRRIGLFLDKHLRGQDVAISTEPLQVGKWPFAAGQARL